MKKLIFSLALVLSVLVSLTSCNNEPKNKENSISVHGFNGMKPEFVYYADIDNEDGTISHDFIISNYDFETTLSSIISNPMSIMGLTIPAPTIMFTLGYTDKEATIADGEYEIKSVDDINNYFNYLYLEKDLNIANIISGGASDMAETLQGTNGKFTIRTDKKGVRSLDFSGNSNKGVVEIYYKGEFKDGQRIISLMEKLQDLLGQFGM